MRASSTWIREYGRHTAALMLSACLATTWAAPIADIVAEPVSPRKVAENPADIYDEVASGLFVIGVEEKIYLEAHPEHGVTLGGANWALIGRPYNSSAALSASSGDVVTLVPDVKGMYVVELTPLDGAMAPTEAVTVRVHAGEFIGAGVFNTHAVADDSIPHCSNACCHSQSGDPRLDVVDQWLGTGHATKLQQHLSGGLGADYEVSCLPCHTLGFKASADNGGFDDIATATSYDLNEIPALVATAANTNVDQWPQLPAALQSHASIQCESCHGPGSNHLGNILEDDKGIDGVNLSINACAQCHDSERPEAGEFYAWNSSTHPVTADLSEGHVADSDTCRICHTGEGFVYGRVNGGPIPQLPTHDYEGVTCSTCHDPHGSPNPDNLRVVGDFTLPSGVVADDPGKGGTCVRCHNSRVSNPETSINSSRGAHYGTAGDVIAGAGASTFGLPVLGNSAHTTLVEDSCVTCHMADTPAGEPGVGGHTYRIRDTRGTSTTADDFVNADNACGACHNELTTSVDREARGDYDGDGITEGIQSEFDGLSTLIFNEFKVVYPSATIDPNSRKMVVSTTIFNSMSPDRRRAYYNYNFFAVDGSRGVHNTSYAIQILQRSYWGIAGNTITDDYPNIDLRGPVQPSLLPTPTPTPTPTPLPTGTPVVNYDAKVDVLGVSPRMAAADGGDDLTEVSTGLNAVGVGELVYLEATEPKAGVTGYTWAIHSAPAMSTATLSATTGDRVTLRPDKVGVYLIHMTPVGPAVPVVFEQRLYAAEWAGVGTLDTIPGDNPIAPQCGTGFCHGGNNGTASLNVLDDWLKSNHSQKLQLHLNGERGPSYAVSCLPCHTVGFNDHIQAVNNGFDDIATDLAFPLATIPTLVEDAVTNDNDNFVQLPALLQDHSSVQCESCHGAGSLHPSHFAASDNGIAGKDLDPQACARCHDSAHDNASDLGQGFYQWSSSTHPVTADINEGHVAESDNCRTCHTGEGFVAVRADFAPIPQKPTHEYHGVTCATCHDPHGNDNNHELRVVGDFTIPNGSRPFSTAEDGGACWRCHNSRIAAPETTATTSSRGAHYGPQADVMLGTGAAAFDLAWNPNSDHTVTVVDSCVHCHMAATPAGADPNNPPLVGGHTFKMRDDMGTPATIDDVLNAENACASCHVGLMDYDFPAEGDYDGDGFVEGTQTEVDGLLARIRTAFQTSVPALVVGSNGRYSPSTTLFNSLTADQKRAVYNYNLVVSDGSKGVHNASYLVQVLQRSYFGASGRSIQADFPGIYLRGPVQAVPVTSESFRLY